MCDYWGRDFLGIYSAGGQEAASATIGGVAAEWGKGGEVAKRRSVYDRLDEWPGSGEENKRRREVRIVRPDETI